MSGRTRVVFIVNSLGFGGAERQTLSLIRAMDTTRFDIRVAVLHERPREIAEAGELDAATVWRGRFGRGLDLPGTARLARFLRQARPEVIVCVNTFPLLVGMLARVMARSRAKTVTVYHTTELGSASARRRARLYQWLMNRCAKVVYVCDAQRQYWVQRGLRADNAAVIHNGIDSSYLDFEEDEHSRQALRARIGLADDDIAVGLCAHMRPEKAHGDLVRAIGRLHRDGRPYKAVFIGDGPLREELQRLVDELGLNDSVKMLGMQTDVRPFVQACDIMALVSHAVETFSLAALESMALRRPLVLSNLGGAAEQVQDGVNGYLFPRGDIDSLVERLQALESRDERIRMGENGRRILKDRFLREEMVEKYERLIESVAGRTPD